MVWSGSSLPPRDHCHRTRAAQIARRGARKRRRPEVRNSVWPLDPGNLQVTDAAAGSRLTWFQSFRARTYQTDEGLQSAGEVQASSAPMMLAEPGRWETDLRPAGSRLWQPNARPPAFPVKMPERPARRKRFRRRCWWWCPWLEQGQRRQKSSAIKRKPKTGFRLQTTRQTCWRGWLRWIPESATQYRFVWSRRCQFGPPGCR